MRENNLCRSSPGVVLSLMIHICEQTTRMWIVIVFLCFLAFALWVYVKVTMGICKSSRHLVGKVVIVTGANAGIGFETAKNLAERGARVILACRGCRNEERGIAAKEKIVAATGNPDVHYRHLDLASLQSVRDFADNVIKNEQRLDILINNAGVHGSELVKTEDGLLLGMQTNHFGPFLLTCLLLPKLKTAAPSRIINVSSMMHVGNTAYAVICCTGIPENIPVLDSLARTIDLTNLNGEKETERTINATRMYCTSKLCNILMTNELARRLKGTGVTANSLHPGAVDTDILNSVPLLKNIFLRTSTRPLFKNAWEGAQTSIYLAVAPEVATLSGRFFKDCREVKPSKNAQDYDLARKLWEISEQFVKLN